MSPVTSSQRARALGAPEPWECAARATLSAATLPLVEALELALGIDSAERAHLRPALRAAWALERASYSKARGVRKRAELAGAVEALAVAVRGAIGGAS